MAKEPKSAAKMPDPAEAALFAIEEALSVKATGTDGPVARPRMPKATLPEPIMPETPLTSEVALPPTPPEIKAAPEPAAAPQVAPPMAAANDDRRNSVLQMTALNERASRGPTLLAWILSLIWLGAVGYYAISTLIPANEITGGLFAPINLPSTVALALAAILPVILIFSIAAMARRAQEMRIAARAMTEAALRMAQPESVAADSIFSLGQAVRREVASMGDGIERAVSRASELEALVHSEVAHLERSYTDNELKIRKLLDDLAGQQTNFGENAEQLRRSINEAQEALTLEMRAASQRITEQVADAGRQVTGELDERREMIAQSLTRAGDSMSSQLSASSADLIERLARTGNSVNDRIAATSADMTSSISDYGQRLVSDITERSHAITSQIETVGNAVTSRIETSSSTVTSQIETAGSAISVRIDASSSAVTSQIETAGGAVAERIETTSATATENLRRSTSAMTEELVMHSTMLTQTLNETGDTLINKFAAHTSETRDQLISSAENVTRTLSETGTGLVEAIGSKGHEVTSTLKATGEALVLDLGIRGGEISHRIEETGTRIADIVATRGDSLAARLVETSDRINQAVTVHGQDLEQSIAATGQQAAATISEQVINARTAFESAGMALSSLIDTRATRAEQQLSSHVAALDERLNSYTDQATGRFDSAGRDMVMALAAQGNRVNESIIKNAEFLGESLQTKAGEVANQLQKFDETMGGRLQGVEALLTIHGDALVDRLTARTTEAATLLENQLHSFDERITSKTSAAVSSYEALSSRVEIGLVQRSEQLNEMLVQRSLEVARTLTDGGRALTDSLANRAGEIVGSIENQLGAFDTRVIARLGAAAEDVEIKGTRIALSLERSTDALSTLLGEQGIALVSQMQGTGAQTVKQIDEVSDRVSTALEAQRVSLSNELTHISTSLSTLIDNRRAMLAGELDEGIAKLGSALDARTEALAARLTRTTDDLQAVMTDGSEHAARTLAVAGQKLGTDVSGVLSRLNEANAVLNAILAAATDNLETIETGLTDKVRTLEVTMDQLVSDTANTTDRVEKQVSILREISGGVLTEASALSDKIQERGIALARAAEDLTNAQTRMGSALESKGDELRKLVDSIEAKRDDVETLLLSFGGVLEQHLTTAEERARTLGGSIASQAEATSRTVLDQFEALKSITSRERDRTLVALKAVADETSGQIDQAFGGPTERFREAVDELRELSQQLAGNMATTRSDMNREVRSTRAEITQELETTRSDLTREMGSARAEIAQELEATRGDLTREMRSARADITQELEATRAEITRGTISMPRDVEAQSSAIRRVVGDQIKAISALESATGRDTLDVAPPTKAQPAAAPKREALALRSTIAPPVIAQPKAEPRVAALRAKPEPEAQSATSGWLSDLLKKASRDERGAAAPVAAASSADPLSLLATDITRLVDQDGLEEAWDQALAGDRGVFTRQLYTLQGQQAFDDIRRRYRREAPFKDAIDRYVEEFERVLKTATDEGEGDAARAYLLSDTGKIYTMLAHAAGRID
jgi:Apolipoprotein A1/A4/E domain